MCILQCLNDCCINVCFKYKFVTCTVMLTLTVICIINILPLYTYILLCNMYYMYYLDDISLSVEHVIQMKAGHSIRKIFSYHITARLCKSLLLYMYIVLVSCSSTVKEFQQLKVHAYPWDGSKCGQCLYLLCCLLVILLTNIATCLSSL